MATGAVSTPPGVDDSGAASPAHRAALAVDGEGHCQGSDGVTHGEGVGSPLVAPAHDTTAAEAAKTSPPSTAPDGAKTPTLERRSKHELEKVADTLREDATKGPSKSVVVADTPPPLPPPPLSERIGLRSALLVPSAAFACDGADADADVDATGATPTATATMATVSATETRLHRAVAAMEEMRKRAARYRETPRDTTDEDMSALMEGLQVVEMQALYDKLFEGHPIAIGKAISKMEREETERNSDSTLVYGEVTFKTLALALHKVKTKYGLPGAGASGDTGVLQKDGGAFYDIGSGTGKPVIAAAIVHPFHKAVGIEILEGLHTASTEILKQWEGGLRDRTGHRSTTKIGFILGDALDMSACDWSDGDVVFANSTCFDDALMRKLASAATALKKGAIFITLTKRLPAAYFRVLEHDMFPMSWGSATVYISQKTTDPFENPHDAINRGGTSIQDRRKDKSHSDRGPRKEVHDTE